MENQRRRKKEGRRKKHQERAKSNRTKKGTVSRKQYHKEQETMEYSPKKTGKKEDKGQGNQGNETTRQTKGKDGSKDKNNNRKKQGDKGPRRTEIYIQKTVLAQIFTTFKISARTRPLSIYLGLVLLFFPSQGSHTVVRKKRGVNKMSFHGFSCRISFIKFLASDI